jgi:hypothetical protein
MTQVTLAAGQISEPVEVGPGTRVTSTGSGRVEWTASTLVDVRNGVATWAPWPKGSTAGYADTLRRVVIRFVAIGAFTVRWDEGRRDEGPEGIYWQEDAQGSAVSVRDFGAVGDGVTDDTVAIQAAVTASRGRIDFGSKGRFRITGPIGFPTVLVTGEEMMVVSGSGAEILVDSTEAIFTSQRSLATPESTDNLYTSKINFVGLNFISGQANSTIFNGDRLYNLFITQCNFKLIGRVIRSFRNKGVSYSNGYLQSIFFVKNHFATCGRIIDAKAGFNIVFNENLCENNPGGIYIDGPGSPAVSVFRCNDNVFEGGGLFLKLGATHAGSIIGNYLEANTLVDAATLKCHIYLHPDNSDNTSGMVISNNGFQAAVAQQTDADWRDIKIAGAITGSVRPPVLMGNWTNSYQLVTEQRIIHSFGNGTTNPLTISRTQAPLPAADARLSFVAASRTFLASTHLSAGVFQVCEISTTALKALAQNRRPCTAELDLFMQNRTAGAVVVGACVAKILLVLQSAEGIGADRDTGNVFVGGSLISFAEIAAGTVFDTVNSAAFRKHFTNPVLTITPNGSDNYLINLSGYLAVTNPDYGLANQIQTHATLTIMGRNNSITVASPLTLV